MRDKAIMLVKDTASDVGLTQRALRKHGVCNSLVIAEDDQEALDYLFCTGAPSGRDIKDAAMLILLDLKLPRINGFEVLRRVRADLRTRRLPVVILSASSEKQNTAAGYDLGTNSHIRKPIGFDQFAKIVKRLILYWLVNNEPQPVF